MACNNPFLRRNEGHEYVVPCGHCAGCRRDKLTMWSDRLMFELQTNFRHCGTFLTLTYDDEHLPSDGVSKSDVHKFLKDFRYVYDVKYGRSADWNKNGDWHTCSKYKYILTSEYGDKDCRPHYHAIIIGADPWIDDGLFKCWKNGFYMALPANSSTIRYTLKYITKEDTRVIIRSGDGLVLNPNFHLYSRGIGRDYIYQHANEFRKNKGYNKGKWLRPLPPYYKSLLGIEKERMHYDTELIEGYETWMKVHPEEVAGTPMTRLMQYKQYCGRPAEISANVKEDNGIKHFKELKRCN